MRVAITGAGGFCGRHLTAFLQSEGLEIHTLGPRVTSAQHHLSDPFSLESLKVALQAVQPDYVFHLAGVASTANNPLYYQVNTVYAAGLLQALELSDQSGC